MTAQSGFHGVYFQTNKKCPLRKPWKAYYRQHGSQVCVGYFATKEEAARAYNDAVGKLRAEYPLNDL